MTLPTKYDLNIIKPTYLPKSRFLVQSIEELEAEEMYTQTDTTELLPLYFFHAGINNEEYP